MAEFRSSARSTGFNAINLPDNARRIQQEGEKRVQDLRRVYQQTIQNKERNLQAIQASNEAVDRQISSNQRLESEFRKSYEQARRKRGEQEIANLKKEQEQNRSVYDRLGAFSEGAMKLGKELYEQNKVDRQAYGLALVMQTGVTAQELADLQNKEFELEVEGAANNNTYQRLKARGASAIELKKLKDLDGWALYGAQKAIAQQAKQNWFAYTNNPKNLTRKFKVGDKELSLKEAEDLGLYSERQNILGQMKAEFFKPYADYDLAFADKYLFPGMREVDAANDTAFTNKLNNDLEVKQKQQNIQELGDIFLEDDPNGLQRYFDRRAPFGGEQRTAVREQMLGLLDQMAGDGTVTLDDLDKLNKQILIVSGKEVTFSKQFLEDNARFSPTAVAYRGIEDKIIKKSNEKRRQRETAKQLDIDKFTDNVFAQYASTGKRINDDTALELEAKFQDQFPGEQLPEKLKNLLTFRDLGIASERQFQQAQQAAMDGSLQSIAQIQRQYPALVPSQIRTVAEFSGIDLTTKTVKNSYVRKGLQAIDQALGEQLGTADFMTGSATLMQFMPYVEKKFLDEIQIRRAKDPGLSLETIVNQTVNDFKGEIVAQKDGSFFQITGRGRTAGFNKLPSLIQKFNNESLQIKELDTTIDGDYDRLLGTERLLGKDPNQDPNLLAGQLPMIGLTAKAPEWLLRLSEESGIPWKQIYNAQAQAYDPDGKYLKRLTLNRVEAAQVVVGKEFRETLGKTPAASNVQQATSQFQRDRGVIGLDVYRPMLNLIASVESSNDIKYGGYDAMNLAGTNGGRTAIGSGTGSKYFGKPLVDFTLGEIREMQRNKEIHAAGRYQFLGRTIDDVLDRADISPDITMDSKFDKNTQDILAVAYFRRSIKDFAGSDDRIISGLGQRWIGLQDVPYEKKLRIVKSIQNDPRYQSPGFQGFDVDPNYEAERQSKYGG